MVEIGQRVFQSELIIEAFGEEVRPFSVSFKTIVSFPVPGNRLGPGMRSVHSRLETDPEFLKKGIYCNK